MPRRFVALAVAVALAAACSRSAESSGDASDRDEPPDKTPAIEPDGAAGSLEWQECGAGIECATLDVPLDYADAEGATIPLSLVRVPADDEDERIGSLLVNPGGPGGSGVEFARFFRFSQDIHDRFDVIGFDPRGVGESRGLTCGGEVVEAFFALDSDPDNPAESAALDQGAEAIAADCGADDGDVLAHVGSDDVVRDMDSIRAALGEDTISFYGFSYGTLLGARYAEMFPDRTRAVVLDGVVDPSHDFTEWLTEQTRGFERAIAGVFDACAQHPGCPEMGASAAYDQVLARVEAEPLPAGGGNVLGPGDLATAAIFATYDPGSWPDLFDGLAAALDGDGSGLYELAATYHQFGEFTQYAAVECVDSPHPAGADPYRVFAAELEAISPRFGPAIANELLACAFWPVEPVGDPQPVTAAGAPPILVIGNTGDAATPFEQAQRVAETLESGVLLTYEGEGHTSYGSSACVDDAVSAYLLDLAPPAEGTVCQ
jgi:pimeloyl-ACP methyl ester carboxylesterase